MVIQQEALQLKAELQLTSHFHILVIPNTDGKTAATPLFQKGGPAYAAPYSYGHLPGSTQCLHMKWHQNKTPALSTTIAFGSSHKAVTYFSPKHCHYSVHFHYPQVSIYTYKPDLQPGRKN